jgi:hypothetical protein
LDFDFHAVTGGRAADASLHGRKTCVGRQSQILRGQLLKPHVLAECGHHQHVSVEYICDQKSGSAAFFMAIMYFIIRMNLNCPIRRADLSMLSLELKKHLLA